MILQSQFLHLRQSLLMLALFLLVCYYLSSYLVSKLSDPEHIHFIINIRDIYDSWKNFLNRLKLVGESVHFVRKNSGEGQEQ